MHPWRVSFGLTCTLAALAVLFGFERLAYLRPYASLIWEQYAGLVLAHLAGAIPGSNRRHPLPGPARWVWVMPGARLNRSSSQSGAARAIPSWPPPCNATVKEDGNRVSCRLWESAFRFGGLLGLVCYIGLTWNK